jgi:hypothetical protein
VTLLAPKRQLARRIPTPNLLFGAQGVIFHQDHLIGVEIVELDGSNDISVQIFDAHIDAVVLEA